MYRLTPMLGGECRSMIKHPVAAIRALVAGLHRGDKDKAREGLLAAAMNDGQLSFRELMFAPRQR